MVNNRALIEPLLLFPKKDDSFYFVQILQRKKDHPEGTVVGSSNNSRLIKAYYIKSLEHLEKYWKEMVLLAELFDARVSINLNPRSFQKSAFQVLSKIAHQMENKDFYNVHAAYNNVCGNYHSEMDKRWLIDIDKEELDKLEEIESFINQCHLLSSSYKEYKILATIPSKSGLHIISNPFNLEAFKKEFPTIDCMKNNPTNVYIP